MCNSNEAGPLFRQAVVAHEGSTLGRRAAHFCSLSQPKLGFSTTFWLFLEKLQRSITMRFHTLLSFTIPFFFWTLASAASWGFDDATVVVHGKKAGVGGGAKEK